MQKVTYKFEFKIRDNYGMKFNSYPLFGLAITSVLLLAGCASQKTAPIVNRTGPGTTASRPASTPAPIAVSPQPSASQSGGQPGVQPDTQVSPIRSGTIDSRPLETKPIDPKAVEVRPAVAPAPSANVMRTQPKGLKRAYSDTVIAELKAADGPPIAVAAPVPTPAPTPVVADVKVDPKSDAKSDPKADPKSAAFALAWPTSGKLIQSFGKDKSTGMAFTGKLGDPIASAADGKVIFSNTTLPQYGKMIIVKHDDDTHSVYAHNKTLLVKEGQQVKKGQKIAELGDSGTTQPKLYFEVRKQGKPVDPQKLLPARP
jgi:lipoprotein NlpD